jgi:predicted amidohydrolase
VKVSLVQMNSQGNKTANVSTAVRLIEGVVGKEHPDLVVLPEYFAFLEGEAAEKHASGEVFPNGEAYTALSGLAGKLGVTIHSGSMVEREGDRYYNTTVVFDPAGKEIARYRKVHLFDVEIPGLVSARESDYVSRGKDIVTYKIGDVTVGVAICYDLRFPELFRMLRDRGAQVIVLPAAFAMTTGKDHWEILVRARAIETQTYFLAVAQTLSHDAGVKWCWGHSMVVDPWGVVIAQCSDGIGTTSARLDMKYLETVRRNVPVADHHVL